MLRDQLIAVTDGSLEVFEHDVLHHVGELSELLSGAAVLDDVKVDERHDYSSGYWFWGKPSSMPPWLGSSQRLVMAFCRVKKFTPSMPWAWESPNREAFQPPKL